MVHFVEHTWGEMKIACDWSVSNLSYSVLLYNDLPKYWKVIQSETKWQQKCLHKSDKVQKC